MEELEKLDLQFREGNPGAVQYGNFINYYQFHPPENRLNLLPLNIFHENSSIFYGLDVGCNAGDLTVALYHLLKEKIEQCNVLGIDIDPALVERAKEKIEENKGLTFSCLNFMNDNHRTLLKDFLKKRKQARFNAVFCLSLTMWIHLNYGDDGLKKCLEEVCKLGDIIVIEPQPWKCYRNAIKRIKATNGEFPLYQKLEIRQTVEEEIERFLVENCKAIKIYESIRTKWGRKLLVFKCP